MFEPAGAATATPHLTNEALIVRDGARLPLRRWPTPMTPKGVVIALHGFSDYSAAFEQLGPWLATQGFDTFAYDQRGFGAAPHPGIWAGSDALVGDLMDAIEAVRRDIESAALPLYVLGESMGGSVAIIGATRMQEDGPDGLILAAPGLRNQLPFRPMWDALFWTAAHIAPSLTFSPTPDPDRQLVPASTKRLQDDPLVIRDIRADYYYGVVQLADRASLAVGDVGVPTLMLHGGGDSLIRRVSICAAYDLLPSSKTLLVYPAAPHLLLHWQRRDRVLNDIETWLKGNRWKIDTNADC